MWWRRSSAERQSAGPETVCRVGGWDDGDEFYDETGAPTYIICDCCGAESGLHEYSKKAAIRYRQQWIARGAVWSSPKAKPKDWDIDAQLQKVPAYFT